MSVFRKNIPVFVIKFEAMKSKVCQYFIVVWVVICFSLISCNTEGETDQFDNPQIALSVESANLEVTLSGSITCLYGEVETVKISWGDGQVDHLESVDFTKISTKHSYPEVANYPVYVTASTSVGGVSSKSFVVSDLTPETSLKGIRPSIRKVSNKEFLVLTLNLHTYQEANQLAKLKMVADVIGKLDVDFIAFQECAQHKSSPISSGIIKEDNMAKIIADMIRAKYDVEYNYVWNWAHYGWDVWEEGVAILSKHKFIEQESRYISTDKTTSRTSSRKVIYAAFLVEGLGQFNIFSAHTSWRTSETDDEQNKQIRNVKDMVSEKEAVGGAQLNLFSIVCGDFNGNPTSDYPWSEGYTTMMTGGNYVDTFLEIFPDANTKPAKIAYNTIGGNTGRIDYIFNKKHNQRTVEDAQIIFKSDIVGMVSDHYGVITKIKVLSD